MSDGSQDGLESKLWLLIWVLMYLVFSLGIRLLFSSDLIHVLQMHFMKRMSTGPHINGVCWVVSLRADLAGHLVDQA